MSEKDWFLVAAVVLVLLSFGSLGMMGFGGMLGWSGMMRSWAAYPFGMGVGFGWFFPLLGLGVLGALVWLASKAVRAVHGHGDDAASVLKLRLAHGEITLKEYKDLVKVVVDGDA